MARARVVPWPPATRAIHALADDAEFRDRAATFFVDTLTGDAGGGDGVDARWERDEHDVGPRDTDELGERAAELETLR